MSTVVHSQSAALMLRYYHARLMQRGTLEKCKLFKYLRAFYGSYQS
nr:hypothetical protein [Enterobacter cloacae complex sp.]